MAKVHSVVQWDNQKLLHFTTIWMHDITLSPLQKWIIDICNCFSSECQNHYSQVSNTNLLAISRKLNSPGRAPVAPVEHGQMQPQYNECNWVPKTALLWCKERGSHLVHLCCFQLHPVALQGHLQFLQIRFQVFGIMQGRTHDSDFSCRSYGEHHVGGAETPSTGDSYQAFQALRLRMHTFA